MIEQKKMIFKIKTDILSVQHNTYSYIIQSKHKHKNSRQYV